MADQERRSDVVGIFEDREQAQIAIAELRREGFDDDQITLASGGEPGRALEEIELSEEERRFYEREFGAGRTLVTVRPNDRYDEAVAILRRYGADDVETRGIRVGASESEWETQGVEATPPAWPVAESAQATEWETPDVDVTPPGSPVPESAQVAEAEQTVRLHEEELRARKEPVQTGEVAVRKEVITETKTIEVPVTREEVVVERRPVEGGQPVPMEIGQGGQVPLPAPGEEIRIPVVEEQVRVEKEPMVKEEVRIGKHRVQETQQVSGEVRREEARIEKKGKVKVRGSGAKSKSKRRKK